jgi:hypothetical protein
LEDSINDILPEGYHLCHPYIGRVSVYEPQKDALKLNPAGALSVNWCLADDKIEVTACKAGLEVAEYVVCYHFNY